MYIMCVKVIAAPSQDSERSCILCVLRLSLYQARTVSGHVYYVCLKLSLYQARTVRGHVYYVC